MSNEIVNHPTEGAGQSHERSWPDPKEINYDKLNICIPTVSVIVERSLNGEKQILVQTRYKPLVDPKYSGYLEIPSGMIERYESAVESAIREVKEETGVTISKEALDFNGQTFNNNGEDVLVDYEPFCVSQQLKGGRSYLNIGFICRLGQETDTSLTENPNETRNPRWINIHELKELLNNKQNEILPMNIPILTHYLKINSSE